MAAQQRSNKRSSRGMSPGRSMAQFGHAGHAGKSQSKAQKHQKAGINTPSRGPGSNPNMGQTPPKKTATVPTQTKQGILSKVDTVANFLGPFVDPTKKPGQLIQLYKLLRNPTGYREDAQSYRGDDQSYRGVDIQPWDENDVSGLAGIDFSNLIGTTPDTDYTQFAGLNQDQIDKIISESKRVTDVDSTASDFFTYTTPKKLMKDVTKLNPKSEKFWSSNVDPGKIVYGDKTTFAQPQEVYDYINTLSPKKGVDYASGMKPLITKADGGIVQLLRYGGMVDG